jgi:RNA polymerase sigma factor (sigma-70 family)
MDAKTFLSERFQEHRTRLRAVAYRMLGSRIEADDAVQEAWLRFSRSETDGVGNLGGWLTTVVARVCLDMLRTRKSRGEEVLDESVAQRAAGIDPEQERLLADSVGPALLVVLETLAPAERLAFVLHDMFAVPFEEIAPIVGRTPTAARQLASRARRRVQGAAPAPETDLQRHRQMVDAFLAASREGNFDALVALLDPDVVLRADSVAVGASQSNQARGAPSLAPETRGPRAVAETFKGRARAAQPALINGAAGAAWALGGQPRAVFAFRISGGKILEIEVVMDPTRLAQWDIQLTPS